MRCHLPLYIFPSLRAFSTPLFGKALQEHRRKQGNAAPVMSTTVAPQPRKRPAQPVQQFSTPKFGSFREQQTPIPPKRATVNGRPPPAPPQMLPQPMPMPMYPTYHSTVGYNFYQQSYQNQAPIYNHSSKMFLENIPIPSNLRIQPYDCYSPSESRTRTLRKHRSRKEAVVDHTIGEIRIVNLVAAMQLNVKLDHAKVKEIFGEAASKNEKFAAATKVRLEDLQVTALLYTNGKMVCTGAKSVDGAKAAVKRIIEELCEKGCETVWDEGAFVVTNVVGTVNLGYGIDCNKFSKKYANDYNPELFNAVRYAIKDPKVTAKIFESGKVNFLGGKTVAQIHRAFELSKPKFLECKKL